MAWIIKNSKSSNFLILVIFGSTFSIYITWHNASSVVQQTEYGVRENGNVEYIEKRRPVQKSEDYSLNIEYHTYLDNAIPEDLRIILSSSPFSGIPLLPLNSSIIDRLLQPNFYPHFLSPQSYWFALLPDDWEKFEKWIISNETRTEHCHLANISNVCLVFHCISEQVGDVFFYKLHNRTNYWTIQRCLASEDGPMLAFKISAVSARLASPAVSILLPHDLRLYQIQLRYSTFMKCDYRNAMLYKRKYKKMLADNNMTTAAPSVPESSIVNLIELRDLLHSLRMTPFICGGTLLGWKRECGIIPYTSDFDFCVPISQYSEGLEAILANHARFHLKYRFGKPSEGLEYTVFDQSGVRMDIFFLYEESNHSWVGGMGPGRMKLKYSYPKVTQLCKVDLLGYLFNAPCNVDQVILADYGPNWSTPIHQHNYIWYYSAHSVTRLGYWPAEEAQEVEKYF